MPVPQEMFAGWRAGRCPFNLWLHTRQTKPRRLSEPAETSGAQSSGTDGASIAAATALVSRYINSLGRPSLPVPGSPTRMCQLLPRTRQHIDDIERCPGRRLTYFGFQSHRRGETLCNCRRSSKGTNSHYHKCVCPDKQTNRVYLSTYSPSALFGSTSKLSRGTLNLANVRLHLGLPDCMLMETEKCQQRTLSFARRSCIMGEFGDRVFIPLRSRPCHQ